MTASHHAVPVSRGSDLAIKDENKGWVKIHRVQHVTRLSVRESAYDCACGVKIETEEKARSLSSGWLGRSCSECWKHLKIDRDVT